MATITVEFPDIVEARGHTYELDRSLSTRALSIRVYAGHDVFVEAEADPDPAELAGVLADLERWGWQVADSDPMADDVVDSPWPGELATRVWFRQTG